jgi:uncharacterized protein (TIGR00255 family)
MPLRSMTGFGRAQQSTVSGTYRVEIRGVNNRYLDIQIRTPRPFFNLEQRIKKTLSDRISRGSLAAAILWDKEAEQTRLTWDKPKVAAYVGILEEMRAAFGLSGGPTLENVLTLSDVVKTEAVEYDEEALWRHVKPVLLTAVADFQKAREGEGAYIAADLRKMLKILSAALGRIEKRAPARQKSCHEALSRKVAYLAGGAVEPQRLATEIAIMADRLDISEECTRLRAHIEKFAADIEADKPAGKRMTFILQEMNREANTIASKANDTSIAHHSVLLKEVIEKMREQVQNIE